MEKYPCFFDAEIVKWAFFLEEKAKTGIIKINNQKGDMIRKRLRTPVLDTESLAVKPGIARQIYQL